MELLVVIGIIAILAGVALGPITRGIAKAKESGAMQTTRTIALAEFQYSNDNSQVYPDGADAGIIGQSLMSGNYVTDPKIFFISGDGFAKQPTSSTVSSFTKANSSYNFAGLSSNDGVSATAPDQLPLVWSEGETGATIPSSANTGTQFTPSGSGPFGKDGIAVCYHSNNAFFRAPSGSATLTFPTQGNILFVDQTFDPASTTYVTKLGAAGK